MVLRGCLVLAIKIAAGALFFFALGTAGNMDYADAKASEQDYKSRVCDGAHSDYLNLGVRCDL